MNQPFNSYESQTQQRLPNADGILALGIISIVGCFCYGVVGIVTGIISLVMWSSASKLYEANPEAYTLASYKNANAGRICATIGLIMSGLSLIIGIIYVIMIVLGVANNVDWSQF